MGRRCGQPHMSIDYDAIMDKDYDEIQRLREFIEGLPDGIDGCCPSCGRSTKRHPGYVIGNHWLESAYERICAGEAEDDVLRDYDVVRVTTPTDGVA